MLHAGPAMREHLSHPRSEELRGKPAETRTRVPPPPGSEWGNGKSESSRAFVRSRFGSSVRPPI
eukprot:8711734-Pyramimonas_sp.AAC.1